MELRSHAPDMPATVRLAAGFTLVELMITILVASILLAVGIPSLRNSIANNRLTAQANDMVAAMTLARSQAITQNQQVTFCRSASEAATACAGTVANWQFWLVRTASGTVVRTGVMDAALVVTSALTNDQIAFASDGLARTNNTLVTGGPHITVCSGHSTTNNKRRITLGAGSRVSTAQASGACP